jgi:hypothetical protein
VRGQDGDQGEDEVQDEVQIEAGRRGAVAYPEWDPWVYASVVDNRTGDATTIPILRD